MYTLLVPTLILVFALVLLGTANGFATGAGEGSKVPPTVDRSYHLFVLAEGEGDGNRMYNERVALPDLISLTQWTRFSLVDSKVKTESQQTWSQRSKGKVSEERSAGVLVQGYDVVIAIPGGKEAGPAASPIEVSFSVKECLNKKGEVLYQPARLAVIRAVSQSKKKSGEARVIELSYAAGMFAARVELR
ncbi:MAG: hypothetical protein IMZ69_10695 [Spirochaetes bacterium]|nr:hypothetical protein [Spirochaetota bacterium]